MISYAPFWITMKEKGISTYALINHYNISSSTIDRLRNNKHITTQTLDDLCRIYACKIGDIVEYIPD